MKILHVINRVGAAGAEIMLLNLVLRLKNYNFDQEILTLMPDGVLIKNFQANGIKVKDVGMRKGVPSPRAIFRLNKVITQAKPDVVHGWLYHASLAATLATPKTIPVIWGIHHSLTGLAQEKWLTRIIIKTGSRLKKRIARYVFVSKTSQKQHVEIGYPSEQSETIPNGFDLFRFRPDESVRQAVRNGWGFVDEDIIIANAARYHPMKNHMGLVRSFSKLAKRFHNVKLVLMGRGIDDNNVELKTFVAEEMLENQVFLLGERRDVECLMNAFDLYVSASLYGEAFPLVIGEAMACGVPCVATDIGDCRDIIDNTGRLVRPGDDAGLMQAMGELISLTAKQRRELGYAARQRIEAYYSLDMISNKYADLYKRLIQQ